MLKALDWLAAKGTLLLPLSLSIGLFWPDLATLMRPLLVPTVFFMLTVLLMRVDTDAALEHVKDPVVPIIGMIWAFLLVPIVFAGVLWLLDDRVELSLSSGLVLALILWASSPPIFSSAPLSYIMRLDGALSLGFLLAAIAIHPIVTPVFAGLFTDSTVTVSSVELGWRLAFLIGSASLCALSIRSCIGRERLRELGSAFDGLNVLGMIIFAIAIMDGIGARLLDDPSYASTLVLFVFALALIVHLTTTALFWRHGKKRALTLGFSSSGRNIAMAVGALDTTVPPDTWLFFAVIQFPIYILPAILQPIYNLLLPNR